MTFTSKIIHLIVIALHSEDWLFQPYILGGEYERLWREDQNAVDWLKSFRVKISLDTSDSAEELRRVIDHLVERC